MSQAKARAKKAAPKKGAASRAKKDEPKTVDFRGLAIELPAKLPGTILFDMAEVEAGKDIKGTLDLLRSLIGEGQLAAVKAKIAADDIGFPEVIGEVESLTMAIFDAAGVGLGE